jgi:DNA polymerase III alpha subunit (gram-positive type)
METTIQIVKPINLIVYDFETTGLLDKPDVQPIELAAYHIDKEGNKKVLHKYILCPHSIEEEVVNPKTGQTISDLTGITDNMLSEGFELKDVMVEFKDLLVNAKAGKPYCVVGHNILEFDNKLYKMMQQRLGDSHYIVESDCFDTGGQFKGELLGWNKFESLKHYEYQKKCLAARSYVKWNLTAAGQHYGIASSGIAHSAIGDIENNLQVFIKQLKKIGKLPENLIKHELC